MTTTNSSLPYIDATDEAYEKKALELIQAEMRGRTAPSVAPLPSSPCLAMDATHKFSANDASLGVNTPAEDATLDEWKSAVKAARIAYEHARLQNIQLTVDTSTAPELFREYNAHVMDPRSAAMDTMQQKQSTVVQKINFERQQHQQERVGPELRVLEAQRSELIAKQWQLREAIHRLENASGL